MIVFVTVVFVCVPLNVLINNNKTFMQMISECFTSTISYQIFILSNIFLVRKELIAQQLFMGVC